MESHPPNIVEGMIQLIVVYNSNTGKPYSVVQMLEDLTGKLGYRISTYGFEDHISLLKFLPAIIVYGDYPNYCVKPHRLFARELGRHSRCVKRTSLPKTTFLSATNGHAPSLDQMKNASPVEELKAFRVPMSEVVEDYNSFIEKPLPEKRKYYKRSFKGVKPAYASHCNYLSVECKSESVVSAALPVKNSGSTFSTPPPLDSKPESPASTALPVEHFKSTQFTPPPLDSKPESPASTALPVEHLKSTQFTPPPLDSKPESPASTAIPVEHFKSTQFTPPPLDSKPESPASTALPVEHLKSTQFTPHPLDPMPSSIEVTTVRRNQGINSENHSSYWPFSNQEEIDEGIRKLFKSSPFMRHMLRTVTENGSSQVPTYNNYPLRPYFLPPGQAPLRPPGFLHPAASAQQIFRYPPPSYVPSITNPALFPLAPARAFMPYAFPVGRPHMPQMSPTVTYHPPSTTWWQSPPPPGF